MTTHRPLDNADLLLIQCVKAAPSLYDTRAADFRISQRKEEEWCKLASALHINALDARKRWTCLRDRYSRELKQLRLHPSRSNDYGRNDFFRQMDFLREFVRKRRERSRRDESWSSGTVGKLTRHKATIKSLQEVVKESVTETDTAAEDETLQIYEDSENNTYDEETKLGSTSAEAYSMIVEETHEPYEHYNVQPGTPCSSSDTKQINVTPVLLTQDQEQLSVKSSTPTHMPPVLMQQQQLQTQPSSANGNDTTMLHCENEDDYFCKSVAAYLRQLTRRHKIKAKVEIYQILEKYIEKEEQEQ